MLAIISNAEAGGDTGTRPPPTSTARPASPFTPSTAARRSAAPTTAPASARWRGWRQHRHRSCSHSKDKPLSHQVHQGALLPERAQVRQSDRPEHADDSHRDHRRGSGFLAHPQPWMQAHSGDADKVFDRMFSTELNPQAANNYNYCIAKKYIDCVPHFRHEAPPTLRPPLSAALMKPSGVTCASEPSTHGIVTSIVTDAGTYTLKSTGTPTTSAALSNSPRL